MRHIIKNSLESQSELNVPFKKLKDKQSPDQQRDQQRDGRILSIVRK